MTTVGPVCHIPPEPKGEPHGPVAIPAIPPAQPNIASLTATVNALRRALMILSGTQGPNKAGVTNNATSTPSGSWKQQELVTEVVRVYNPNDHEQYVDVQRVNKLVMKNDSTKQNWTFNRPPNPSGT